MRKRRDLREAYERVMKKSWGEHDTGWQTRKQPVEIKLMRSAVKRIWRKLTGRPCPYSILQTNRGGLRVQYKRAAPLIVKPGQFKYPGKWVLYVNPKQGWYYMVHDLGHYLYQRLYPAGKPHCDRHLEMERIAAEIVVKHFLSA